MEKYIMTVHVFSFFVGFGSACLVVDTNNRLAILIDAGTTGLRFSYQSRNSNSPKIYSADIDQIIDGIITGLRTTLVAKLMVMITHGHEDHYSFIQRTVGTIKSIWPELPVIFILGGLFGTFVAPAMSSRYSGARKSRFILGNILKFGQLGPVFSVVNEYEQTVANNCYQQLSEEDKTEFRTHANPVTADIAQEEINNFCEKELVEIFCCSEAENPDSINEKGIIIVYHFKDQRRVLVFMGDAPYNNNDLAAGKLSTISENKTVVWYQIPHHGSNHHGEFEWLSNITGIMEYAMLSVMKGLHRGLPSGPALQEAFAPETSTIYRVLASADDENDTDMWLGLCPSKIRCTQSAAMDWIDDNPDDYTLSIAISREDL